MDSIKDLGVAGVFVILLIREVRELLIAGSKSRSGGNGQSLNGSQCALAKERAEGIQTSIASLATSCREMRTLCEKIRENTRDAVSLLRERR